MPAPLRSAANELRAVRRALRGRAPSLRGALAPPDERVVFVVGSPRSGTTFLAGAVGGCPGFVDLGEVATLKAAIPGLVRVAPTVAAPAIRRSLARTRRLALTGGLRAVEQTPEVGFVGAAAAIAFPEARFLHIVRDGRDVVCSLVERGWLSASRTGRDDAGLPYGAAARFWVEAERRAEFERASEVRRAAWAWRCYVEAARAMGQLALEIRYERLAADHRGVAEEVGAFLDAPVDPLDRALRAVRDTSIGRYRSELSAAQLADVEEETGALLDALGYLQ